MRKRIPAERKAELMVKMQQAGFVVEADGSIGEVVVADGIPVENFNNKFSRAWIERGEGSAGLVVNYLCIKAGAVGYDGQR